MTTAHRVLNHLTHSDNSQSRRGQRNTEIFHGEKEPQRNMRQLLRTVHLFPSSPPKNIFDTKIHLYVQKKKLFQLSGLQTSEAALKKKKEKRFKLSSYYIHECETYIFYRSQHKHHKLRVLESGTSSGCGGREKERADLLCNGCHVCNCVSLAQTRAQP